MAAANARRAALLARVTSQLTETMDAEEALAAARDRIKAGA